MEQIIFTGHLGRDPELRYTPDGDAVANFSVAINYRVKGEEKVKWFSVSVWGKQAESCNQYLAKGSHVLVQGRMVVDQQTGGPRIWYTQDGLARASLDIMANWVEFLSKAGNQEGSPAESAATPPAESAATPSGIVDNTDYIGEEEIPF